MAADDTGELLGHRRFTSQDQHAFAEWSGDRNPMHLDPVAARRTHAGAPVVYGIHLLLWALEETFKAMPAARGSRSIRTDFKKYVHVDQDVSLHVRQTAKGLTVEIRSDAPAVTIKLAPEPLKASEALPGDLPVIPHAETPIELEIGEMGGCRGRLLAPGSAIAAAFPTLAGCTSPDTVAAIGQLSRLVGMVCPGLHSIFSSLEISLGEPDTRPGIAYRARSVDDRTGLVTCAVSGSGLAGSVLAFVRPKPVEAPSVGDLAARLRPGQFEGQRALVVGGSRGLGAVTAKMIAAGGGSVVVTYATGKADAEAVAGEINAFRAAPACRAAPLDVTGDIGRQLDAIGETPTHVYYFATPQIFLQKPAAFDSRVLRRFLTYYADAVNTICTHYADRSKEPLTLLYPSSSALDERPKGMTEYAMAKAAGEVLCDDLAKNYRHVTVIKPRIPRTMTDQTATIARVESRSAADVVAEILNG